MKVLFFQNIPSPYRVNFFNELGKEVELTVIFDRENAKSRNSNWINKSFEGFKYYFLKGIKASDDGIIPFSYKKYLAEKYDLVILGNYHTPTAVLVGKYLRKKHIKYGIAVDGMFKHENENSLKLKMKRKLFSGASFFLTTGEYSKEVISYYGGNNAYIYPFTSIYERDVLTSPTSLFEKERIKKELKLEGKNVLFVGQFIERKGIDILLNSFKNINANLIMVGGKLEGNYLKLKNDLKLNVIEPGFISTEELNKYYLASDLFVLPTNEDQWGLVINEALAKGLPVVTTDMCLAAYEMLDGAGIMVKHKNIEELSIAINKILSMDDKGYQAMQIQALNTASKYTLEKMTSRHIEIFNELLK